MFGRMRYTIKSVIIITALFISITTEARNINIIPLPNKISEQEGSFTLKNNQSIGISSSKLKDAALYLKGILSSTGYHFNIKRGNGDINLSLDGKSKDALDEGYTLSVTNNNLTIKANNYRGIVNGISTVRQLLPVEIESGNAVQGLRWIIPNVEIADTPAYHWRGLMLDVARHFYNKKEVEQFLDLMALYKFNKFHWHLTDDQGWRIQIKKYPLLTEKGAWRKMINIDQICMNREKNENNPDFAIPKDKFKVINGDTLYGGYYTQKDIKEIVKYAAVRGIDIIPEIDMPGHCSEAIANYPYLSCFNSSPLCPGKESTFVFCKNVDKEIFRLFPYKYIHIGGDEVDKTNWKKCPYCQKVIKEKGLKSEDELQAWFTHQMEEYFNSHGKELIGWDEILEGGLSSTATVDWWRGDHGDVVRKTTSQGNQVILCPTSYCYFDYQQDDNTLKRLYTGDIVPDSLSEKQHSLIKGIQANIWTEMIPSKKRLQYMVFPRALALSEKAWTDVSKQSWDSFFKRLKYQLRRLDVLGVNYRNL